MKSFLGVLCLLILHPLVWAGTAQELLGGKRVLILGDSITQRGDYVTFLEYYLDRSADFTPANILSIGLSSETVSGLSEAGPWPRPCVLERLPRALAAFKPAVVLACYGMNDGVYAPASAAHLAAFLDGLHRLIAQVRAAGAQVVLITPPPFDHVPVSARGGETSEGPFSYRHPYFGYDETLTDFTKAMRKLIAPGVRVIDLHTPMRAAVTTRQSAEPAFSFTRDGVHPDLAGHLLMARIIAAGLGLATPDGDLSAELRRIEADPLYPLVRDRRELRSEAWLPFIGYTREATFKTASVTAAERVAARLADEIAQRQRTH
ncbi:SGNH/GDSL hydrolase family protein [Horticoccus luteus]|uniref:SGNH/GDSL hydrolase family protein n=1 Tax=Horticoccus luteus TaxID=2862869 RepID=A0A8F9XFU3_9BACT|nr:SGNH/GDSL hydrolase family protein [Horticoccus luteus]QYM78457.1 SGNH/GDSL hydrolase family protein [Horticoccus luteus]